MMRLENDIKTKRLNSVLHDNVVVVVGTVMSVLLYIFIK